MLITTRKSSLLRHDIKSPRSPFLKLALSPIITKALTMPPSMAVVSSETESNPGNLSKTQPTSIEPCSFPPGKRGYIPHEGLPTFPVTNARLMIALVQYSLYSGSNVSNA